MKWLWRTLLDVRGQIGLMKTGGGGVNDEDSPMNWGGASCLGFWDPPIHHKEDTSM